VVYMERRPVQRGISSVRR